MGYVLIAVGLGTAVEDWIAVGRGRRGAEYLLKPLTLALFVAAAVALRDGNPTARWAFTVMALLLSLAGDVFLMLPSNLFVAGLASFLVAHLAYVAAFNPTAPPVGLTLAASVVMLVVGGAVFTRIRAGMLRSGRTKMTGPVALYLVAIAAMVVSAVATLGRPDWTAGASVLAIAGAVLFFVSDSLIGWTRFVREVPGSRVAIMVTYHLAQAALLLALLG